MVPRHAEHRPKNVQRRDEWQPWFVFRLLYSATFDQALYKQGEGLCSTCMRMRYSYLPLKKSGLALG
jgi:hypothetical protein